MAASAPPQAATPGTAPAGKPRALIFLVAGLALLAAFLVVTKVVMKPASPSPRATSGTTVPVTHGLVRTVAGAATAAAKKLDSNSAAADSTQAGTTPVSVQPGTVASTSPATSDGPKPNTVRNPFQQ
jgi:di/tricarboxylate transporter